MPKLSDTIARLAAMRAALAADAPAGDPGRLTELPDFGSNPGDLRALAYVPPSLRPGAALVVVLHGCTQTAAGYDLGAGWSQMADRHGFALLFPEQQRQNNANLCFNWFTRQDQRRGGGEPLSIRQMISAMIARHGIDPARVFVTGLSAGGAMASVMLATYPEVFAGGAIIAGLPYGSASTLPHALERMRGQGVPGEAALAEQVREASPHAGPWPTLSIWHGSDDAIVSPANAAAILGQWRLLHGLGSEPSRVGMVDGHRRRTWCDDEGRAVIEDYSIAGMDHGTPLGTAGAEGCGQSGAFMLDVNISSTHHICRFWNLIGDGATVRAPARPKTAAAPRISAAPGPEQPSARATVPPRGVGKIIEDALRSAGLMR